MSFQLGNKLRTRFGASSFNKSIDFDISDESELRAFLKRIDQWTLEYIFAHSARFFSKVMSKEVVAGHYKPLLHMYGESASVRTKINVKGHRVCDCWDAAKNLAELPVDDWLSNTYDVQVSLPQLYLMRNESAGCWRLPLCASTP